MDNSNTAGVDRPFDMNYVAKTTMKHCRRDVNISIRKTLERLGEFDNNPAKAAEVLQTLSFLHTMIKLLEEFQAHNPTYFKGN